jgi:SnoaL-like protein
MMQWSSWYAGGLLAVIAVFSPAWSQLIPGASAVERSASAEAPEAVVKMLVRANAEKDMATLERLVAKKMIGYTIGGRRYVDWAQLETALEEEFKSVERLEIPILDLQVWERGDVAWFAMEIDYIRYVVNGSQRVRMLIPLRDTGVLERREGQWLLVNWHESLRTERMDHRSFIVTPENGKTPSKTR